MAVPQGFIGTIEDDDEIQNDDIDSEEDEVNVMKLQCRCTFIKTQYTLVLSS